MNLKRENIMFILQICPLLVYGTVKITSSGTQIIGQKLALTCAISPFTGTASWAQDGTVRTTCTSLFCTHYTHGSYTTFTCGSNHINVTFNPVDSSVDGLWTCINAILGSDAVTVTAMNETIRTVKITSSGTQIIGQKLALTCAISPFTGTASWAQNGTVRTTCTSLFCTHYTHGSYTTFTCGSNHINVTFNPVDSSVDGLWTCINAILGSDAVTVTAMNETINPSTTAAPSTYATTPVKTNDGSKDNVKDRNIGIGVGISALIVIIIIIIIIVLVKKRGNKGDNAKSPKQDNSNKTWEPIVNEPGTPEHTAMQHSKPWDHAVTAPGNTEHVYMQNDHHVDYDGRYNSCNPEHVSMPNEYHVDYDRRNYSGNPEHEPLPRLPPRRNYSGSPEHEPLPRLPPAHYDR